jgi:hypothetical protein
VPLLRFASRLPSGQHRKLPPTCGRNEKRRALRPAAEAPEEELPDRIGSVRRYDENWGVYHDAHEVLEAAGGLASQADLARRWGIARQRVHEVVRAPEFPTPVGQVNGHPVWLAREASDAWWGVGRLPELDR